MLCKNKRITYNHKIITHQHINNMKVIQTVKIALDSRQVQKPSTECIVEGLEICLRNKTLNLIKTICYK